ncbi:MAG: LysR family transcriptional regulator [Janthinobacterium lividum]
MDTYQNFKAFAAVAETQSFSASARRLRISPSVLTKRINQLEAVIGQPLFTRSTRQVDLTPVGARYLARIQRLLGDVEMLIKNSSGDFRELGGHLRIKAPTALSTLYLSEIVLAFQALHPAVTVTLDLIDRPVDPIEEGFDIAIGAQRGMIEGVVETPLCPLRRRLYATPAYLARKGTPRTLDDLAHHDCLFFSPDRPGWNFAGEHGPITVQPNIKFSSNDLNAIHVATLDGNGIAMLSAYLANPDVASGRLVPVLTHYAIPENWIKALVPQRRAASSSLDALLAHIKRELWPYPPWQV